MTDIAMSCLYLIQQPQYRTITCLQLPPLRLFIAHRDRFRHRHELLLFVTAILNIALSLVVSTYRLPPRLFNAHRDRHRHELLVCDTAIFTPSLQCCQFVHPLYSTFLLCPSSFCGYVVNSLNPVFKISHITQASFPELVIDGHYDTSPNQQEEPPTLSFSHSEPLPDDASQARLREQVWALDNRPYLPPRTLLALPWCDDFSIHNPSEIEEGIHEFHLSSDVARSWKT